MRGQGADEVQGVEALGQDLVKGEERAGVVPCQEVIYQGEGELVVQYVQVADDVFVFDVLSAEGHRLVEDGERVAHGTIGLGGYYVEGFVVYLYAFFFRDTLEVAHHVGDGDAVEVVGLASAQDGGKDLVLLGGGQDEDGVCRGFFQCFEEGVEGGLREHVHLVDDIHAVLSYLGRHLNLLHECLDIFHGVVGRGIQFVDAVASPLLEGDAGLALPAGFHLGTRVGAVDHLGEDTGRGGLTHAARSAEKVCVRELPPPDRVGQRAGDGILADERFEGVRPVLPGRYDIVTHRP